MTTEWDVHLRFIAARQRFLAKTVPGYYRFRDLSEARRISQKPPTTLRRFGQKGF